MKLKHAFTALLTLLFLFTPVAIGVAAGEENGNGSSLMNGPFIILAFATLVLMIYYTVRD
ncbi:MULTISPECIES: hypothetical protein [Bacillaceae]|uniref:Uncharacterized protein n=1 Tax=Evansella alkalicola TaxID=745819 RepID=A0ABS6JS64_9BACI|nr:MULTISPECIES: hypothetical protein [Bacillaceae]MBU9721400.1 hypothetical protein [Bacillus alkalicola]